MNVSRVCRLQLVEGHDVDRLHVVLESLDALLEIVGAHLVVLDDARGDQLLDTIGDRGQLDLKNTIILTFSLFTYH